MNTNVSPLVGGPWHGRLVHFPADPSASVQTFTLPPDSQGNAVTYWRTEHPLGGKTLVFYKTDSADWQEVAEALAIVSQIGQAG